MRAWRKIHATILESEQVSLLSDGAVVLLTFLIVAQDDAGYYPWTNPKIRRLTISRPNWTIGDINTFANELIEAGIAKWEYDGIVLINGEKLNGRLRSDVPAMHYQKPNTKAAYTERIRSVPGAYTERIRDVPIATDEPDSKASGYAADTKRIRSVLTDKIREDKTREEERLPPPPVPLGSREEVIGNREEGVGEDDVPPLPPDSIFSLYLNNIGDINPILVDELKEAEELYPAEWIEDAIKEAVFYNKRSWRYISRILERCRDEGRGPRKGRGSKPQAGRQQPENQDWPGGSITVEEAERREQEQVARAING